MITKTILVLSDSLGETAESVARAAASQFDRENFDIIRIPYIATTEQIDEAIRECQNKKAFICHTIVSASLREYLHQKASEVGVETVDIMGPMLSGARSVAETEPRNTPGMVHKLDQDYFKKVEAIEFAVKYDDGKNPLGFLKADVVIIGVSRTSKTPLSMFLAYKRIKAANLPLVPEVPVPEELFKVPPQKVVGLVIDPFKLNNIRTERLRAMGLGDSANYADVKRIQEELEFARGVMRKVHCPILDVTNKSIEETATLVMELVRKNEMRERN